LYCFGGKTSSSFFFFFSFFLSLSGFFEVQTANLGQEVVSWSLPVFFSFLLGGDLQFFLVRSFVVDFRFLLLIILTLCREDRRKNPSAAALRSFFFDSDVKNGGFFFPFLSFPAWLLGFLLFGFLRNCFVTAFSLDSFYVQQQQPVFLFHLGASSSSSPSDPRSWQVFFFLACV
jgi:hypothetical protein